MEMETKRSLLIDAGIGLALMALAYFLKGFTGACVECGLALVLICAGVFFKRLRSWKFSVLLLVLGCGVASIGITSRQPPQAPPSETSGKNEVALPSERPHLQAVLVVDGDNQAFHFVLTNVGKQAIGDFRSEYSSSTVDAGVILGDQSVLNAGARRTLSVPSVKLKPREVVFVSLHYRIASVASSEVYNSAFRFITPEGLANGKALDPEATYESVGDTEQKQRMGKSLLAQLDEPEGTVVLALPTSLPNGAPNFLSARAVRRDLLINPVTRKVAFLSLGESGKLRTKECNLGPSATVSIAAAWKRDDLWLYVDGKPCGVTTP